MNKVVTSKEELLDTARQIVFQEGIDQLSIRVLAKKLNISVGAVYNYFPSKSDLLLAIVESFCHTCSLFRYDRKFRFGSL